MYKVYYRNFPDKSGFLLLPWTPDMQFLPFCYIQTTRKPSVNICPTPRVRLDMERVRAISVVIVNHSNGTLYNLYLINHRVIRNENITNGIRFNEMACYYTT